MGPNDRELRIMRILQDLDEVRRHIRKCTLFAVIVASVMLAEVIVFTYFPAKLIVAIALCAFAGYSGYMIGKMRKNYRLHLERFRRIADGKFSNRFLHYVHMFYKQLEPCRCYYTINFSTLVAYRRL
jgi:hypothetical protein